MKLAGGTSTRERLKGLSASLRQSFSNGSDAASSDVSVCQSRRCSPLPVVYFYVCAIMQSFVSSGRKLLPSS